MKKTAKDLLQELQNFTITEIKEIRMLLANAKNISKKEIIFNPETISFTNKEISLFYNMLERYKKHEPISKIINKKPFWKHNFYVDSNVLDPRPETELIIESALKIFNKNESLNFIDIGTGSGCILLSLLSEFKNSHGIGIDISKNAIYVARTNQSLLNVKNSKFKTIDWNELLNIYSENSFDVIVSNPPYIRTSNIKYLDESVKNYDPMISLDGGEDGLNAYRDIAKISNKILKDTGAIFLEIGYDQSNTVLEILEQFYFYIIEIVKDLNGINRIIIAKKQRNFS